MQKTKSSLLVILAVLLHIQASSASMSFIESGAAWELTKPLKGIMAHAAVCGDIDGDDNLDLYVGNFCDRPPEAYLGRSGPIPNVLLINEGAKFRESDQSALRFEAITSGAVFVDLDDDKDLDLYVSNNSKAKKLRVANKLFENINGRFREFSGDDDTYVIMGGRNTGVLDYDGDGRLDIFMANWFPQKSSKLYLNRNPSNHWLRVRVVGRTVNRMGIGAKVKVYPAGELSRADKLRGFKEIGTGFGFCSTQEAVAHFGLGELTSCDVEIVLLHNKGVIHRTHVQANQLLVEYEPVVSNMETAI